MATAPFTLKIEWFEQLKELPKWSYDGPNAELVWRFAALMLFALRLWWTRLVSGFNVRSYDLGWRWSMRFPEQWYDSNVSTLHSTSQPNSSPIRFSLKHYLEVRSIISMTVAEAVSLSYREATSMKESRLFWKYVWNSVELLFFWRKICLVVLPEGYSY